jgi:hypothetical protein
MNTICDLEGYILIMIRLPPKLIVSLSSPSLEDTEISYGSTTLYMRITPAWLYLRLLRNRLLVDLIPISSSLVELL